MKITSNIKYKAAHMSFPIANHKSLENKWEKEQMTWKLLQESGPLLSSLTTLCSFINHSCELIKFYRLSIWELLYMKQQILAF